MISWIRKLIYDLYGKAVEEREAKRIAEEYAAAERADQERKVEILARQLRIEEKIAEEKRATLRREVWERDRQARLASEQSAREAERQRAIEEEAMAMQQWINPFQVGEKYENRKGTFTVVTLSGGEMRLRWETGEETIDTVESQARIFRNIQREITSELKIADLSFVHPRDWTRCARCGAIIYSDNAEFYGGKYYGSTCIAYVKENR